MQTKIIAVATAAVLAAGIASTTHAAAVRNPVNPKPSELLINHVGGPHHNVWSPSVPMNGEWYQGRSIIRR
jgi:hypothetical protein